MDQQHLEDPPLDVLQQRVRDGKLPHPTGGLGDPPAEVVPVQRVSDGVQRPGGDAQIPHKGEALPIDDQVPSPPLLKPAERYKLCMGNRAAVSDCTPPVCGNTASGLTCAARIYARNQPTGRDARLVPERDCGYRPCQQARCRLYLHYSIRSAAVKRRWGGRIPSADRRERICWPKGLWCSPVSCRAEDLFCPRF